MSVSLEEIRIGGIRMRYCRFGGGARPLVILPGLSVQSVMGAAEAVEKAYAVMEEAFTVYLFDRRDPLPRRYSVEEMAADTAAVFDALGLRQVCLFGASQGGMIALCLAARRPDLVSRLALGSTAAKMGPEQYRSIGGWVKLAEDRDPEGLYLAFGAAIYPPAVYERFRPALLMAARTVTEEDLRRFTVLARGTEGFDATPLLSQIRCPVLALHAADDRVLPGAAAALAQGLADNPGFETFTYEGYGHAAFDTAPDYRERLLRFFMK